MRNRQPDRRRKRPAPSETVIELPVKEGGLAFLGELSLTLGEFFRGKARCRKVDLTEVVQECGANAVGIVTLIALL